MCYGCYEHYGKPSIDSIEVNNANTLIHYVYEFSMNGGNCHIVLDDWNLEDEHIDFCLKEVDKSTDLEARIVEKQCLEALKALTIEERASALAKFEGFIS